MFEFNAVYQNETLNIVMSSHVKYNLPEHFIETNSTHY